MEPDALASLGHSFAIAFALSALSALAGRRLLSIAFPADSRYLASPAFLLAGGFFVGVTLFLVAFTFLARLGGARAGLWGAIAALLALAALELARRPRLLPVAAAFVALTAVFAVTNVGCWLEPDLSDLDILTHAGSIHSGRYANYSYYVALNDRVPRLAQNLGQSLLASATLLLGGNAPLAALMAWVPLSLAALACLLFGLFRAFGLSFFWSGAAAYFVLFCNVALSLTHILVLDNGSPLAFLGYTDTVLGAGTFAVAVVWSREWLLGPPRWRGLFLPALLAAGWCWSAPQLVILAPAAVVALALASRAFGVRLVACAAAVAVGVAAGGSQHGTFLPHNWREATGAWVCEVQPHAEMHPYFPYVLSHWTDQRQKHLGGYQGYERTQLTNDSETPTGRLSRPQLRARRLQLLEAHLWTGLRLYGFLVVGLVAMAWRLSHGAQDWSFLLAPAAAVFLIGFAVVFLVELGGAKWWLTRFLVPATLLCLVGLALAVIPKPGQAAWRSAAALALIFAGTAGPLVEMVRSHRKNGPLAPRLAAVARHPGPFVPR